MQSPSSATWNPTQLVADTRLAAFETDTQHFVFDTSTAEASSNDIDVKVLFRRADKQLMDWKAWDVADVVMMEEQLVVSQ